MLKVGIKKELMFFTRSFKLGGIIIAAIAFAVLSPLMMKLSGVMIGSIDTADADDLKSGNYTELSYTENLSAEPMPFDSDLFSLFEDENLAYIGVLGSFGDLTNTLLLVFMIVTMYSAGGELKKRSMIIPLNAGLSTRLYVLPKYLVYPTAAAVIAFGGVLLSALTTLLVFGGSYSPDISGLLLTALAAAVYDAFIITLYFTLGLCTARAGIATIILFGGSAILSVLFTSFGADKFHPFALKDLAQEMLTEGERDYVNLLGSIGVTLLIMLLCYFVTVFVISAKKTDNRGKEGMEL